MGAAQSYSNSQIPSAEAPLRKTETCPEQNTQQNTQQNIPPECPVKDRYKNPNVYNVYSQRVNDPSSPSPSNPLNALVGADILDPKNNMPLEPNQYPCPGQRKPLPVERMQSTIPKGGTDATWLYPSPQMVFNALKRKGKGDDVTEDDMDGFVHAHNAMNERTWREVLMWESLHHGECSYPTLLKFLGKPHDLSPLARIRTLLGGPEPFDRHDWVVDRCGQEVRYVIDFYFNDDKAGTPQAFEIIARPAVDSFGSVMDRMKMSVYKTCAEYGLPCPFTGHANTIGSSQASTSQQ